MAPLHEDVPRQPPQPPEPARLPQNRPRHDKHEAEEEERFAEVVHPAVAYPPPADPQPCARKKDSPGTSTPICARANGALQLEPTIAGEPVSTLAISGLPPESTPVPPADVRITVSLTKIPLNEAVRYVAGLANMKIWIGPNGIRIVPISEPEPRITRALPLPAGFFSWLEKSHSAAGRPSRWLQGTQGAHEILIGQRMRGC